MARKKQKPKYIRLNYKNQSVRVLLDKVLIFRLFKSLHGRFWGVAGLSLMVIGFSVCFVIRPDLVNVSTAFSDFGTDVRTSPYFAGSVFIAAYGMWRWRNYLARTWKRAMPVTGLLTITILGLYVVALVPLSWNNRLHMAGMVVAGISMVATVVVDGLLSRPSHRSSRLHWRVIRVSSVILILGGGWLTLGSSQLLHIYDVALLGETAMLTGYFLWVGFKTYQGEGNRTQLSRIVKRIVLVD